MLEINERRIYQGTSTLTFYKVENKIMPLLVESITLYLQRNPFFNRILAIMAYNSTSSNV